MPLRLLRARLLRARAWWLWLAQHILRERAPSHRLGCSSQPPPKPSPRLFDHPGRGVSRDHFWRVGGVRASPPALLLGADQPADRAASARLHPQQRTPQPGILSGAQARRVVPPRVQEVGPRRRSRHLPKAPAVAVCGAEGAPRGRPSTPLARAFGPIATLPTSCNQVPYHSRRPGCTGVGDRRLGCCRPSAGAQLRAGDGRPQPAADGLVPALT